jgi:hypothetical protein
MRFLLLQSSARDNSYSIRSFSKRITRRFISSLIAIPTMLTTIHGEMG